MNTELKYCLGWMGFALLSGIFAGPLLNHIPNKAFILVVLVGLALFVSGIFFAFAVHESFHRSSTKK
jgi:hypothetical protein